MKWISCPQNSIDPFDDLTEIQCLKFLKVCYFLAQLFPEIIHFFMQSILKSIFTKHLLHAKHKHRADIVPALMGAHQSAIPRPTVSELSEKLALLGVG